MQFDYFFKVGMPVVQVEFKTFGHSNMTTILERIGGKQVDSVFTWTFPTFVTSNLLKEIIHNTCFECGGLMESIERKIEPKMTLRICSSCGHYHT